MPNPDEIPAPGRPMPDWLKEIFNNPEPEPLAPCKPLPEREKEPA